MPRDSITTLQQLDDRGLDVRAWCWTCGRGSTIALHYLRRFADLDLTTGAARFRCLTCDSADAVALYPASRRHLMPARAAEPALDPDRIITATDLVAAFFFGARAAAKAAKRDPAIAHTAAQLKASLQAKKNAPKRVPTRKVKLRIVGTPKDQKPTKKR